MSKESFETGSKVSNNAYPYSFPERTINASDVLTSAEEINGSEQTLTGRVLGVRNHSAISFLDVSDPTGTVQVIANQDTVHSMEDRVVKAGDIIAAHGIIGESKSGQASLLADTITTLSRTLHPIHKHLLSGQSRTEERFLDLATNVDARKLLIARSGITRATRDILTDDGLLEVETPIVNTFYNGGVAKPFLTHINGLKSDAFLRVTSELYLKQLVAGGIDGVYEITKQFRNESPGAIYNPEFTVCEAYYAYKDDEWVMDTVEKIAHKAGQVALDILKNEDDPQRVDFSEGWRRISMHDAVAEILSADNIPALSEQDIINAAQNELGVIGDYDKSLQSLFKRKVEATLQKPTFITDLPRSLTPMAKGAEDNDAIVKKVMFYARGIQMGDGCYEENDPHLQLDNFTKQYQRQIESGFPQYPRDADFMSAIDHAIPPMGGIAIGYDRMIMMATGAQHIKDVIAFRPKRQTQA